MTTTLAAPVTSIVLAALTPDVVRSCIVLQPSPPPEPGEEPPEAIGDDDIYTPVAPGVTYAGLPEVTIVDTSPDQLIGCIIDTADNPQGRLNALFPAAIDGDGVIERSTNDIWVYDGSEWNNVGPTPGPTIVTATIIPPWNEILTYEARIRTRLLAQSLAYALQLLTEPDPLVVRTRLFALAQRVVKPPSLGIDLAAETPEYENPYSPVQSVVPVLYTGNSSTQTISGLPWSPSLVWIKSLGLNNHHVIFDVARGPFRQIQPSSTAQEITSATTALTAFTANGFTVGNSTLVNGFGDYVAWTFPPVSAAATNTTGTITTTVRTASFYSIVEYQGNGVNNATFGHGLGAPPTFVFTKQLVGTTNVQCGGSIVGNDTSISLNTNSAAFSATDFFKTQDADTFTVGTGSNVNGSGVSYIAYAFRDVPNLCKGGTYSGNGDSAGQAIDVGFKPDFLIVKRKNGTGGWNVIDIARSQTSNDNQLLITNGSQVLVGTDFYELTPTGFTAKRGTTSSNHDLNTSGATYLYLAFSSFRPTVLVPPTDLDLTPEVPAITVN